MAVTLEDLDKTVQEIARLVARMEKHLYPNGKPDWVIKQDEEREKAYDERERSQE